MNSSRKAEQTFKPFWPSIFVKDIQKKVTRKRKISLFDKLLYIQ